MGSKVIASQLYYFGVTTDSEGRDQVENLRTSLAVQLLRPHAPNAEGMGSIPGQGTKILHTAQHSQKRKKKNLSFLDQFNTILLHLNMNPFPVFIRLFQN